MASVKATFESYKDSDFSPLKSPNHHVKMGAIFTNKATCGVLRASTVIDASIESILAWDSAKMSRENLKLHAENKGKVGLERSLERINAHCEVFHVAFDLKIPGFLPREWLTKGVWKWTGDGELLVTTKSYVDEEKYPFHPKTRVRASNTVMFRYKELEPIGGVPQTLLTYYTAPDLGGAIPRWVVDKLGVSLLMYVP
jgi:hypothetical protein